MIRIKTINITFFLSLIFHLFLFIIINQIKEKPLAFEDLREITFIDQSYRPEVAKIITSASGRGLGKKEKIDEALGEEIAPLDLTKNIEKSQGKIDLRYFSLEKAEELTAIKININNNSPTKTVEEILQEQPIKLTTGEKREGIGFGVYSEIKEAEPINLEAKILKKEKPIEFKESKEEMKISLNENQGKNIKIAVTGPISQRKILKKVLPQYPHWAIEKGICGYLVLKIWVSPEGKVEDNVEVIETSGYPELDNLAIKVIKEWTFEPLAENEKKEIQWGIIKFRFELI
jgi:TonB family protein